MFGLLGPNGAGKSSLMRTIATLQDADEGSIHLGDIDVLRDPAGREEFRVVPVVIRPRLRMRANPHQGRR